VKGHVKCFKDVLEKGVSYAVMDAGIRVVEVETITGTVDKCGELDEHFRYIKRRDRNERSRRYKIGQAYQNYTFLPPIDLYRYRGEFYVVDGNRRVATAIQMGIAYIDATVTEYVSRDDYIEIAGALYRRRFEIETGIRAITLTFENGFEVLLREVGKYTADEDTSTRGRSWYSIVYLPRCKKIEKSSLPAHYGSLRTGDIYVLIDEFYRNFMGGIPEDTDYDTIISGFVFAHGLRRRRKFRSPVHRLLTHFLLNRTKST
jgi:hypothetical protein